ncbi:MAG: extracellular solute-binding protein [Alphaproteobacteria bacterium]|nr:extracellular solute-binding protein [Alphaproteobacteria bacterium]
MAARFRHLTAALVLAGMLLGPAAARAAEPAAKAPPPVAPPAHGLAMHGDLKYGPGFTHFDYVNPSAPKGGTLKLGATGTFDSLNPFILKGANAAGVGQTFDTLATASQDEPFSEYGLVAKTMETPPDRSWIIFTLRPEARFHDGRPITTEDVEFTFNTLIKKGHPFYRFYFGSVAKVEKLGPHRIKFTFKPGDNRELPLILGQLPVLPAHFWKGKEFDQTTLAPTLGSGPYKIKELEPGRSITYERVADYWGKDLAVNKGQNNFEIIRYDYYRDDTVAIEALKKGEFDVREENNSKEWATAYDSPAIREGLLIKKLFPHQRPTGMQGFTFNTRRWMFRDRRVRWALAHAFDFEWSNRNLFFGAYSRTKSYFSNSELASRGLPSPQELALLEPYRGQIPDEVFTREYQPPSAGTNAKLRANLLKALEILKSAGWVVRDGKLVEEKSGRKMVFEVLLLSPAFQRIVGPFIYNLRRLGIEASMRTVDTSQYQNRVRAFDFDMIVGNWGQSLSPGNEQRSYWNSRNADEQGGRNYAGIKSKAVDELIEKLIAAPDRRALVTRTRALDRVLLWGHYVIPNWHIKSDRFAFWDKFGRPPKVPLQGTSLSLWWFDKEKAARINAGQSNLKATAQGGSGGGSR